MLTKTESPEILKRLGILPKITNINLERRDKTTLSFNFELSDSLNDKKSPWFSDKKVIEFFNYRIIICLNEDIHNDLLLDKNYIYSGIPVDKYNSSNFIEIKRKISSLLNKSVKTIQNNNLSISTSFSEQIVLDKVNLEHLSIFIAVYFDKEEVSKKFNINQEKLKNIIGIFTNETFIKHEKVINSKLQDISVFKNKEKFQFNSKQFDKLYDFKLNYNLQDFNDNQYFSQIYFSLNKKHFTSGVFFVDIEKIFLNQAKFTFLFSNSQFKKSFFSSELNYLPEHIIVSRINQQNEITTVYDATYKSYIEDVNFSFKKINIDKSKKLCFSFCDKNTFNLKEKYKYQIELIFGDKTITYLENIKNAIINEEKKIEYIINIANYGNFYQSELGYFSPVLFTELAKQNLSISQCIIKIAEIISQFQNLDQETISSIINLSKSSYFNFEILDSLMNILSFFKSEITRIQNNKFKNSNKISVKKLYDEFIEPNTFGNRISIFNLENETPILEVPVNILLSRSQEEIEKYYTTKDLNKSNKITYLTPSSIVSKNLEIIQNNLSIDKIDYEMYNTFLVDTYYQSIFNENTLNLTKKEKLINILNYYGITFESINNEKDEDLIYLFDLFLDCIVIKDKQVFNYNNLKPESFSTKTSIINRENLPISILSFIQSFENNEFAKINKSKLSEFLTDERKMFALYMNYKTVYKLQYLDTTNFEWKELNLNESFPQVNLLCRYLPYLNEQLNIEQQLDFEFDLINEIFVLSNERQIGILSNLNINQIPFKENLYALYPFGSRVYATATPASDSDFILILNKKPETEQILTNELNFNIISNEEFQNDLLLNKPYAMECYFLPKSSIIKEPPKEWKFKINVDSMKNEFLTKMKHHWNKAEIEIRKGSVPRGKKIISHALRSGLFYFQIIRTGKIINYSESNDIWNDISNRDFISWDEYKKVYEPLYLKLIESIKNNDEKINAQDLIKLLG